MNQVYSDTLQVEQINNGLDTLPRSEYFLGNIIPLPQGLSHFPEDMLTTQEATIVTYLPVNRNPGTDLLPTKLNSDFSFCLLSFSFLLLALLSLTGRKFIASLFSVFNFRKKRDQRSAGMATSASWPSMMMFLFVLLNIPLFVVISSVTAGMISPQPGFGMIRTTTLAILFFLAALLLRHLISSLAGSMSGQKALFNEYMSIISGTWFIAALSSCAISTVILFTPLKAPMPLIYTGATIILLLLFIRIIRLLILFLNRHLSIFYFILYLCALELLPILVVMKAAGIL